MNSKIGYQKLCWAETFDSTQFFLCFLLSRLNILLASSSSLGHQTMVFDVSVFVAKTFQQTKHTIFSTIEIVGLCTFGYWLCQFRLSLKLLLSNEDGTFCFFTRARICA